MDLPRAAGCRLVGLSLLVILLNACSAAWLRWEERTDHYTVQSGDTLYQIAFKHQLDYREIAWWNGIGRDYVIQPGQVLVLVPPLPGELRGPPRAPTSGAAVARRPAPPAEPDAPRSRMSSPAPASEVDSGPPTGVDGGPRRWQWPTRGDVLAGFDPARGRKGIDIGGRENQPIHAAGAGKVVYAGGALKGYGQLLIIKHGEEYLSAYGHNARLLVREGQTVTAGQQIANMGLGPENRPLLHFEIRRFGKPSNPLALLPPPS